MKFLQAAAMLRSRERLAAGIVGALACLILATGAQADTKLRFGFTVHMDGPGGLAAQKLAKTVEELTHGEVTVTLFPDGQLGGDVDLTAAVRAGNVDIALVGTGAASSAVAPALQVTVLPFIWKSRDTFWSTVTGPVGDKLLGTLDGAGIKGLAFGTFGERGFITKGFAVNGPDDLKGRKIRVTQSQVYLKTMEAMGANPVPLPYAEVYTALQQGAVDGVETSDWAMVEAKFYEVATDMSAANHYIDSAVFLMNKAKFDALTPDQQKAMIAAARAGGQTMFEEISKTTDSAIGVMEKAGLKITHPDPAKFTPVIAPVYKMVADDVGQDLIDEVIAAQK